MNSEIKINSFLYLTLLNKSIPFIYILFIKLSIVIYSSLFNLPNPKFVLNISEKKLIYFSSNSTSFILSLWLLISISFELSLTFIYIFNKNKKLSANLWILFIKIFFSSKICNFDNCILFSLSS